MNNVLVRARAVLEKSEFAIESAGIDLDAFIFEDSTTIGFVLDFSSAQELIQNWEKRLSTLTSCYQIAIRRSKEKSWNAYAVLLCEGQASDGEKVVLQSIEENLAGTRKIVRSGLPDETSIMNALLPLLPLQGTPELPAVDMEAEIRSRASELPDEALRAFFSSASETIAMQVIEEAS